MKRFSVCIAAAFAATFAGTAFADAPPDARHPVPPPGRVAPYAGPAPGYGRPRYGHRYRPTYGHAVMVRGSAYGPEPRYYPGLGNASPNAGLGVSHPQLVAITQYREAYIGRGLFYNTPGEPPWPSRATISVRY